jgi:hypothetical protein
MLVLAFVLIVFRVLVNCFSIIATRDMLSRLNITTMAAMTVNSKVMFNGLIAATTAAITPHKDRTSILNLRMFFHQKTITHKLLKGFVIHPKSALVNFKQAKTEKRKNLGLMPTFSFG